MSARPVLRVRDARADEQVAMEQLTLAAYAEYAASMTPSSWAGLKQALITALNSREPVERIVALREGQLVGSVLLYPAGVNVYHGALPGLDWPELRLLAVLPSARGQGVGQALMDECVRRARLAGATALGLHSSRSMDTAIRMYQRMGFVRTPEYDFQPRGAELVEAYRLSLPAAP